MATKWSGIPSESSGTPFGHTLRRNPDWYAPVMVKYTITINYSTCSSVICPEGPFLIADLNITTNKQYYFIITFCSGHSGIKKKTGNKTY